MAKTGPWLPPSLAEMKRGCQEPQSPFEPVWFQWKTRVGPRVFCWSFLLSLVAPLLYHIPIQVEMREAA